jgi:transaldolase
MKLFLDTANYQTVERLFKTGLINGITTNPTHLSKEKESPVELVKKLCALISPYDVSVEVTELEPAKVYDQAKKIAALASNIVVKVPCSPVYFEIIKNLVLEGIPLNITLVFSVIQALMVAKLGVKYISPFIGRLDDIDAPGIQLIYDTREMIDRYGFKSEILAASLRSVSHLHEVIMAGADIATITGSIFETATVHPLTEKGMALFEADWKKLGIRQFP